MIKYTQLLVDAGMAQPVSIEVDGVIHEYNLDDSTGFYDCLKGHEGEPLQLVTLTNYTLKSIDSTEVDGKIVQRLNLR